MGSIDSTKPGVLEFFAGVSLARIGLEATGFRVTQANDFDPNKKAMYGTQFEDAGDHVFALEDTGKITADELPRNVAPAWASSPCTDLPLAGGHAGLAGNQSGTFRHFVRLLEELEDGRPQITVLESLTGLVTSHGGDDLIAAIKTFSRLGYSVDTLAISTRQFLPRSRPRLFLVGVQTPRLTPQNMILNCGPIGFSGFTATTACKHTALPFRFLLLPESTDCVIQSKSFLQMTINDGATNAGSPSRPRYRQFNADDWMFLNQKKVQSIAPPIEELEKEFRCGRRVPMIFQDASEPPVETLPSKLWSSQATDAYKSDG